jgi:hypothetical protein
MSLDNQNEDDEPRFVGVPRDVTVRWKEPSSGAQP